MKLNNLFLSLGIFFAFVFAFGITGCQERASVNSPFGENFTSQEYAVFDFEDSMNGVADASIDIQMSYTDPLEKGKVFRHDASPGISGRHLFHILRKLNLNDDQKNQVKDFMISHRECVKEPHKAFREAAAPYIQAANEQRREILAKLKSGEITRERVKELIKQLNIKTRELIQSDPAVQAAQVLICNCKTTLINNIGSILNDRQLVIWNEWVAGLRGPCFRS